MLYFEFKFVISIIVSIVGSIMLGYMTYSYEELSKKEKIILYIISFLILVFGVSLAYFEYNAYMSLNKSNTTLF